MNHSTQEPAGLSPFVYTLIYGAMVIVAAQLRVPLLTEGFVVSAGVILFSLLMLLLNEFATLPVVFISAAGVMVTRAFAEAGGIVGPEEIWETGVPEFTFYAVYGILICLLFRYLKAEGRYPVIWIALVIPDFVANFIEMYIRVGTDPEHSGMILSLLLVAVIRSTIILAIYALILRYGFPVAKIPRNTETMGSGAVGKAVAGETRENVMAAAACDAAALYQKLACAHADAGILEQAKILAENIEEAAGK